MINLKYNIMCIDIVYCVRGAPDVSVKRQRDEYQPPGVLMTPALEEWEAWDGGLLWWLQFLPSLTSHAAVFTLLSQTLALFRLTLECQTSS